MAHLPNPGGNVVIESVESSRVRTNSIWLAFHTFWTKKSMIMNTEEMTPLARAHLSLDTQRSTELSASHTQEMVAE